MKKKIKAVFFDLDGTLVNTLASLKKTMDLTMEHFDLEGVSLQETRIFVGTGYKKYVEKALEKNADKKYKEAEKWEEKDEERAMDLDMEGDEIMGLYDEVCEYYASIFPENSTYQAEAYPGIKECITALKEKGIAVVCITNKSKEVAEGVLASVFSADSFTLIIGDDGEMPLKPDKAPLLKACGELGITKDEAVMVGDTKTDLDAARNAKMSSIGCLYGFRDKKELVEHGAEHMVEDGYALLHVLEDAFELG
jgi:HAD hydrolase, family IA, variant 1